VKDQAEIVIVGAGIMGLAIAYNLAKLGKTDILVVDRSYLCGGASGRNGGGVRAQWSSEANVRLMQESIRMCRDFASEMKINVWFRQGGYLFLVRSAERLRSLEASVKLQNECGLGTKMLTPKEARKVVPELDADGILAASYNPDDGVVFPWPFVWGFAQAAQKLGVEIATFHDVVGFETSGKKIRGITIRDLKTNRERKIATSCVVNAAGAWSPEIAKMLGVELPNKPHRHEICSTEPLKPWLKPLVADLTDGLYFSQSTRGEIVGGIGNAYVPHGLNQESSYGFLGKYARSLTRACPVLGKVKVLRQWAGCYDLTPDANPIVGEIDEVDDFYQASGFMGHGFMMAPVVGKLIAQYMVEKTPLPMFERWNLRRYKEGKLLSEAMIIG
jgi:sarcosine oxidase subunit beta